MFKSNLLSFTLFISLIFWARYAQAQPEEVCVYAGDKGVFKQAESRAQVPAKFRKSARCFSGKGPGHLAKPEEIDLKGTVRHDSVVSSIGRIELRWPRKVELLFGRTPQRAVAEAASAVSRALKKSGFPSKVQSMDLDWQIVFMDEELPEKQIPLYLVSNCHPAWMPPPSNIYVVSQRVAAGCSGGRSFNSKQADAMLTQILIHEMGHAVEYQLLTASGASVGALDRMRAEGFAAWFEQYAGDLASVIPKGYASKLYKDLAAASFKDSPRNFNFAGSGSDYARASMYFKAVEDKRGVRGVTQLYQHFNSPAANLFSAIQAEMGWSRDKIEEEALAQTR